MMETALGQLAKWNSKRLVAAGGAGYAVYALAAAGTIAGLPALIGIAGLAGVYLACETFRPSAPTQKETENGS